MVYIEMVGGGTQSDSQANIKYTIPGYNESEIYFQLRWDSVVAITTNVPGGSGTIDLGFKWEGFEVLVLAESPDGKSVQVKQGNYFSA